MKVGEPFMIFEDDVILSKRIVYAVNQIEKNQKYNFINLETSSRKKFIHKKKVIITKEYSLSKLLHNKSGAAAYILWPKFARYLLSNYEIVLYAGSLGKYFRTKSAHFENNNYLF